MSIRLLIIISSVILITSCAVTPKTVISKDIWQQRIQQLNSIKKWSVKGRISVNTAKQKFTSNLSWQHHPEQQQLLLYGSFGETYAELIQHTGMATLTLSNEEVYRSDTLAPLLHKMLGYKLPVGHLQYWIQGQVFPDSKSEQIFDKLGLLKEIHYQQWTISYKRYQHFELFDNISLPAKINITDGKVTLRLSLRDWNKATQL